MGIIIVIALPIIILLFTFYSKSTQLDKDLTELRQRYSKQNIIVQNIESEKNNLIEKEKIIDKKIFDEEQKRNNYWCSVKNDINNIMKGRLEAYKYIAPLISDVLIIEENKYVETLKYSRSIINREKVIKINELKAEKKRILEENRILTYKLDEIYSLFPHLAEFNEYDGLNNEYIDDYHDYLTELEYKELSDTDKNKRALEYYKKRKKTNWEIGRDFERFIGYEYEKLGNDVIYYGIEKKLEDLGRDLIALNSENILVVQCKYWSKYKIVHEKHLAQLYGTYIIDLLRNYRNTYSHM